MTEANIKSYIKDAVKDFQSFAGLSVTGELDPVTVELMGTPRCGVRDKEETSESDGMKSSFVLQGSRWQIKHLTYR